MNVWKEIIELLSNLWCLSLKEEQAKIQESFKVWHTDCISAER